MSEELKERRFEAGEKVRWNHEDQWKSGVFAGYANSSGGACCLVECGDETHVVGPSLVMPIDREPLTVCFELDPNDEAELRQWGMTNVRMWRASIGAVYSDRTSVVTLFPREESVLVRREQVECKRCHTQWPPKHLRGGWCVDCLHRLARDILDTGRCRECGKFGGVHTKDCPVGAASAEPGEGGGCVDAR